MNPPILVVVCTHNPREDYLREAIGALRAQTLPLPAWNLLVVDNASTEAVAGWLDLSWHPAARILREEKLGTAHARHRALREARASGADIVLFVDDDNILAPNYLESGMELGALWPQLGCWGGQLLPRYEISPPAWIGNYLKYLAVTPLSTDRWTNTVYSYDSVPPTAGCFVRSCVWQRYLELLARDPRRLNLGARGGMQVRGEDTDLVLTALDLGLGIGRFCGLRLQHLIPAGRLTASYMANLVEGTMIGTGLLEYLRYNKIPRPPAVKLWARTVIRWQAWRLPEPLRTLRLAELRGRAIAREAVLAWQNETTTPVPEHLQTSAGRA